MDSFIFYIKVEYIKFAATKNIKNSLYRRPSRCCWSNWSLGFHNQVQESDIIIIFFCKDYG